MFEEKKPVREIIEEMRRELLEEEHEKPDPFEQLFGKKTVELAKITKTPRRKKFAKKTPKKGKPARKRAAKKATKGKKTAKKTAKKARKRKK